MNLAELKKRALCTTRTISRNGADLRVDDAIGATQVYLEESISSEDHMEMFTRNETIVIRPLAEAESQRFRLRVAATAISRGDGEHSYLLRPHTNRPCPSASERQWQASVTPDDDSSPPAYLIDNPPWTKETSLTLDFAVYSALLAFLV
jgi:hypothetical protein